MKARKLIDRYMNKWTYCMGLGWWRVDGYYLKGKEAKKEFPRNGQDTTLARAYADWRYSIASVYFNMPAIKGMEPKEIENMVIHELCHVLVNEMREGELHHEERVVTTLTKAFLWTDEGVRRER